MRFTIEMQIQNPKGMYGCVIDECCCYCICQCVFRVTAKKKTKRRIRTRRRRSLKTKTRRKIKNTKRVTAMVMGVDTAGDVVGDTGLPLHPVMR